MALEVQDHKGVLAVVLLSGPSVSLGPSYGFLEEGTDLFGLVAAHDQALEELFGSLFPVPGITAQGLNPEEGAKDHTWKEPWWMG